MSMSRKLSEEEKKERQRKRDDVALEKELHPAVDKYGIQILRILREEAPEHPGVKYNSIYFEKRLDVANITILRAIDKLKKNSLIKEKQVNGSYVINEDFSDKYYSEDIKKNICLVASLGGILQQYKNTPLLNSVKNLIYFLQPEIVKQDNAFSSGRVTVAPKMEYDINLENWEKVYYAIQQNQKIRFRYTKSYTNNTKLRTVWPYQLVLDNGSVYLSAYSEYADLVLLYDLNFMTSITVTNEKFELPKDYDFTTFCGGGRLGAFKSEETKAFKIRFTGYAKDWIKLHKWADDQQIKKEDEDSTTIIFTSAQEEKVFEEILKWGSQAEPLAPASLVRRWKNEITKIYEKINGNG